MRWVLRIAALVVVLVLLRFVVVPQFADAGRALASLASVSIPLVIAAFCLELLSFGSYSALSRSVLGRGVAPRYRTVLRVDLIDFGVGNVVPGGGATAQVLRIRLLTLLGVPAAAAVSSAAIEVALPTMVLGVLFGAAFVLGGAGLAQDPFAAAACVTVLAVVAVTALGLFALVRHREGTLALVAAVAAALPFVHEPAVTAALHRTALHVAGFSGDRARVSVALGWSCAYWLLDAASLIVFLRAFGDQASAAEVLLAYGLANILALLPITPGGLGVIEGILVPTLVALGSPHPLVVLGVVAWRLAGYWLPIPLSVLAYLSLRIGPLRPARAELRADARVPGA